MWTVMDVNDNAPVFPYGVYELTVTENIAVGTRIGGVHAFDADIGEMRVSMYVCVCTRARVCVHKIPPVLDPYVAVHRRRIHRVCCRRVRMWIANLCPSTLAAIC
ncbi:unnamed protein product [Sphagnum balticum]